MFKRIMVPVDQSQLVSRELRAALSMARAPDAELYVLRIKTSPADLDEAEIDLNIIEDETRHLLAEVLSKVGSELPMERIHPEIRSGPVVGTIIEAAEELQIDLIVVGSHGRHRFLEMLTGNTAEKLVNKTSASVLVVKPEGFPFLSE
ncbi:MAG TPA: universal stress protein [Deltaproteobacteria bacterium]|nr:universal stress protein [Deltaproteobacteria bacterium]